MPSFISTVFKAFWAQYPLGTRLNRSFISHQLNETRVIIFNNLLLLLAYFIRFPRLLSVSTIEPRSGRTAREEIHPTRQGIPSSSRAAIYGYYATAYPLWGLVAIFAIITAVFILSFGGFLFTILFVVLLGIWVPVMLLLFLLWFTLYRYPVFEIIYPRLRKRILTNNSHVYSRLPEDVPSIRVVRLRGGHSVDEIECDLLTSPLADMNFEALSYVWGATLAPYTIRVNGKRFYVTYNLYSALREMRHSGRERLIWIDAMCINQSDNMEKGSQVQMMRDIYTKASRVIVWLGKGTKMTSPTFELVRRFSIANKPTMDSLWATYTSSPRWGGIRREFIRILDHEWFERAWIIQEVVVGHEVVVQRGPHQVEWEAFHKLLAYAPFEGDKFNDFEAPIFAVNIQEMRMARKAGEPIPRTLLGLAIRFRFQSATFGSDKIYALLGLLKEDNPSLVIPDYDKSPEDVFLQFTVSCLVNNRNLIAIAMAAGAEVQGVSWCRNWCFNHDGLFEVLCFSVHQPSAKEYSASGTQAPIFEVDLPRRVLSLQGYQVDIISKIGNFYHDRGTNSKTWTRWDQILLTWERVASKSLNDNAGLKQAFERTITADCWSTEPLDWRQRYLPRDKTTRGAEDKVYKEVVSEACNNRRFFVTKKGRFGLGPWNLRKGDSIYVLLGGATPFILRQCNAKAFKKRVDEKDATRTYYKVIGEAFVDGLMYYEGSMEEDIQSGKVVTNWFHLL